MTKPKKINPPRQGVVVPSRSNRTFTNARFRSVSDALVASVFSSPLSASQVTTDAAGYGSLLLPLTAVGVTGANFDLTQIVQLELPHLTWLYSTARNFDTYRITRMDLIVVGLVGSDTKGDVAVRSSKDYDDLLPTLSTARVGGTSFPLASLANKNRRIPLHVNTGWIKVTDKTTTNRGGVYAINNSINDLTITTIGIAVIGAPVSTNVLTLYVEYDVEFASPISGLINA